MIMKNVKKKKKTTVNLLLRFTNMSNDHKHYFKK